MGTRKKEIGAGKKLLHRGSLCRTRRRLLLRAKGAEINAKSQMRREPRNNVKGRDLTRQV